MAPHPTWLAILRWLESGALDDVQWIPGHDERVSAMGPIYRYLHYLEVRHLPHTNFGHGRPGLLAMLIAWRDDRDKGRSKGKYKPIVIFDDVVNYDPDALVLTPDLDEDDDGGDDEGGKGKGKGKVNGKGKGIGMFAHRHALLLRGRMRAGANANRLVPGQLMRELLLS
jgi:hypothetical protein